ncbi:bifunctional diaminohydroxyphosphoribosylaminopyrimidine deaminase/5-amino-6-(5-phosphoribosylamino)uracil reductase RibD [Labrys okinawensis]|uniref:Riboflavin biosynthesis protein RibD n=1 Tax=Labrys okinawensis TaxID=346911 RepID=A0A2S9QCJ9_9HYPH|nr:bifunctional diaminohydroxyphosphoribosylaminopyrimidine deaminase/5-amino-6-(5-phosphoribosylamino)uracil reductase RibD [Labrys okinawensis]PRH87079.1 bifunctional diaminohydroxyphosphoribosylaminopyrimidine deaminase/5-amino-6-(5-phosphoribosylamino)uracil reductase RibD [Labrys okinawensis]
MPVSAIDALRRDERFMRAALALGRRGLGNTWPNPAVGCVIVRRVGDADVIVGRGWTQPGGRPHAETQALAGAGSLAKGATAYVTLEPCSHYGRTGPCADALARGGIARVVGALRDPDPRVGGRGFDMLRRYGLEVREGVLADEAFQAHVGHITRVTFGRPGVTVKIAVSADGKLAGPGGRPVRITGEEASAHVHLMRAQSDAIAVGIGTVLNDDPLLTVRLPGMAAQSPLRIVFDSRLRLPLSSRLVETAREVPVWVMARADAPVDPEQRLVDAGVEVMRIGCSALSPGEGASLDLGEALRLLGTRGVTRLLVEAGPRLAAGLVEADLVEEFVQFTSPEPIGEGVTALTPLLQAKIDTQLPNLAARMIGHDTMTIQRRN